jgi:hypothetical protein
MSTYLTQAQLDSTVDLPISLPLADLYPQEWIVLSTHQISAGQALTVRWLQAYVFTSDDPTLTRTSDGQLVLRVSEPGDVVVPAQTPQLVVDGLGIAFLGLYRGFNALQSPAEQAAQETPLVLGGVTSTAPFFAIRDPESPLILTDPGAYSFVLCNNTSNRLIRSVVNGAFRASLGVLPNT